MTSSRIRLSALLIALVVASCQTDGTEDVGPGAGELDGGGTADGAAGTDGGGSGLVAPACGHTTTPCPVGGTCREASDCATGACRESTCRDVNPANGAKDGDETDVDCGGLTAPACQPGKGCIVADDCTSRVCTGGVCQAPSPTDGVENGDETDIDCGGSVAPKCATGKGCATNVDCNAVLCDSVAKVCKPPAYDDGIKNGDETGLDCGGGSPTKCDPGQGCKSDVDCNNVRCDGTAKTCSPPSSSDGLKNGTETDVDCGGGAPTNAPKCKEAQGCSVDEDCSTTSCSFDKKCVRARSCKGTVGNSTAGIVTCGQRETEDATKVHESCCRSLPLPTTTSVSLDKYEVTAGRFRQFVETVGPDIRNWAKTEIANNTSVGQRLAADLSSNTTPAMVDLLPSSATPGDPLNLVMQIGATVMDPSVPSMVQGCFQDWGNPNSQNAYDNGSYGAATYYWDQAVLQQHFGNSSYGGPFKARRFTKAQYDEKSMNCAPYWMYAAFCAWDGGRLPTQAEMNEAWGAAAYPWGTTTYSFPFNPGSDAYQYEQTANYFNNSFYFYHYPDFGDARDLAGLIGAPGRFIVDKTTKTSANGESWMDLGANLMEITHYATGSVTFCDVSVQTGGLGACTAGTQAGVIRAKSLPNAVWVGGSWEGHYRFATAPEPMFTKASYNLPTHTQYGKLGVRCARASN